MAIASGLHSQDRSGNLGRLAIRASLTDLLVAEKGVLIEMRTNRLLDALLLTKGTQECILGHETARFVSDMKSGFVYTAQ
jgi:hypothetical protein